MKKVLLSMAAGMVLLIGMWVLLANHISQETEKRARQHAQAAKIYCEQHHLSTDYCVFVDFDVHSGKNRLFVWDFKQDKIAYSTVCAHGSGRGSGLLRPELSNEDGSHCSSVGRYTIGIERKMHNHPNVPCLEVWGMDPTCSNAHKRAILIHPSVGQVATYPLPMLHRTLGCFGLSLKGFHKICEYREAQDKPMLLWAYGGYDS